ncbi:MAG: hypothetical protein ACRDOU_06550 [Streptosporangiaceae bacterium]
MSQRSRDRNELIVSDLFLRQTVGWMGTLLPIVLLVGNAISSSAPRPDSISGYYYTDMRNIFVGTLWALGVFLVAYRGYDGVDESITNVAGLAAIGVALCPTKPTVCTAGTGACPASSVARLSTSQQVVGDIHLVLAAITLIALGLMALRFAKRGMTPGGQSLMVQLRYGLGFGKQGNGKQGNGKQGNDSQQRSTAHQVIYRASGMTILCCVLLAALSNLLPASVKANWPWLFIFESLAVFAFGVSWFVKGRTLQGIVARIRKVRHAPTPSTPILELEDHR